MSSEHLWCIITSYWWLRTPFAGSHQLFWCILTTFYIMRTRGTCKAHEEKRSWFLNVFYCFRPCERMRKQAFADRNTQHFFSFLMEKNMKMLIKFISTSKWHAKHTLAGQNTQQALWGMLFFFGILFLVESSIFHISSASCIV